MNKLGLFERKGNVLVGSRIVAEKFEKRHDSVVSTIKGIIKDSKGYTFGMETPLFIEQKYIHPQNGQEYSEYVMNKRAFILLMMRLKGEIAFDMQNQYIDRFEYMEAAYRERQTTDWLQTRKKGKLIRREETDAIQLLMPYAQEQGSKNFAKLYINYSKMVNKAVGIGSGQRETAPHKTLMLVALMEDIISHTIIEEMEKGIYYKNIYQICKNKIEQFVKLAYLPTAI